MGATDIFNIRRINNSSFFYPSATEVFYKKGVLKNFTTFTGKHLIVSPWVLILPPLAHHNPAIFSVPQVLQNLKKFPQAHKKL